MKRYLFLVFSFLIICSFYYFTTNNNRTYLSKQVDTEISTLEQTQQMKDITYFHRDFTQFIHDGNSFVSENYSSNKNIIRDTKGIFLVTNFERLFVPFDNENTILELTNKWQYGDEAYKLKIRSSKPITTGIPGTSSMRDISKKIENYYYYDLNIVIIKKTLKADSSLGYLCDTKGIFLDGLNFCTEMIDLNTDMNNIYTNNLRKDDIKILNSTEDINFEDHFLWKKDEIVTLHNFSETFQN